MMVGLAGSPLRGAGLREKEGKSDETVGMDRKEARKRRARAGVGWGRPAGSCSRQGGRIGRCSPSLIDYRMIICC